ncbi:hypothetical protein [Pseudomonas putida]|uniref:CBM-cenC domain-containing protein n=1 Tax=Pseudomonas putida TaxID=303 RepID=A0A6I6XU59_PSEPU|nr:hypothetical protein [Pseudomonas putida]QHG63434.1 hypothetical protein C2H86_02945 [Pseudomonas putida]
MTTKHADYSECTKFSDNQWNDWKLSEQKRCLSLKEENLNTYASLYSAPNDLPSHSSCQATPLIRKTITNLVPGNIYAISLLAKRPQTNGIATQLSWSIDDVFYHRSDLKKTDEWERFIVDFRATASEHTLTLGSVEPEKGKAQIDFDEIRFYPCKAEIDFEIEQSQIIESGRSAKLRHFTVHNQGGEKGSEIRVANTDRPVDGMSDKQAILLAKSQSTDKQRAVFELNGEYSYIEFAWTQIHHNSTASFHNKLEAAALCTISTENLEPTSSLNYWIKYRSNEGELIKYIVLSTQDHSYIDFMTMKSASVLTSHDKSSPLIPKKIDTPVQLTDASTVEP